MGMLAAAERMHQLPAAMSKIESNLVERSGFLVRAKSMQPGYLLLVLCFVVQILLFCSVLVFPKFQEIYRGLGMRVPAFTRVVFTAVDTDLALTIVNAINIVVPLALYSLLRQRRPWRTRWLSWAGDLAKWMLPLFRPLEESRCRAQTAHVLRMALESGMPLEQALGAAAELDLNAWYKRRVLDWRDALLRGQDPSESARRAGVGRTFAWAFAPQNGGPGAVAMLEMVERIHNNHHSHAVRMAISVIAPLCVLAVGVLVGLVASAVVLPMVQIIEATMALV